MNFEFAKKINPELESLKFEKVFKIAIAELEKIPSTDFHAVQNMTFIEQVDAVVNWIDKFYQTASQSNLIKAFYFEMNEFDVNTDMWFIEGFSYNKDGGLNLENLEHMDWLCDYHAISQNIFTLTGFEHLQNAFAKIEEKKENDEWTDEQQNARDWCEQIIIVKFMELMREVHLIAKAKRLIWSKIPIYFTEHGYDFIVKSE